MNRSPYLIIERGHPFDWGAAIPLAQPETLLGRKDERWSRILATSDRIAFAKGMVALAFSPIRLDETLDFTPMFPEEPFIPADVQLDPVRQTIRLNGTSCPFSEKEYRLLELLIRKERRFVSRDEIIRCVWPERADEGLAAPVGPEEINSLLYRIRKKTNYRMALRTCAAKVTSFRI